jgi:hypothetical protein
MVKERLEIEYWVHQNAHVMTGLVPVIPVA